MIRYTFALATSQPAVNHSHSGCIPAAQVARQRGCGSLNPIAFWHTALALSQQNEQRNEQRNGCNGLVHSVVLSMVPTGGLISLPIGLSTLVQHLVVQQLELLKERIWWKRSGRYGCTTVPKQD